MAARNDCIVAGWLLAVGCTAKSEEIGASGMADSSGTAGQTGEGGSTATTAGSGSDTSAMTDSGSGLMTMGTDTSGTEGSQDTGTGGGPNNAAECNALDTAEFDYSWFETTVYAGGESCMLVPPTGLEGECILINQVDSCGGIDSPTCPDNQTGVVFSQLGLEIGAVELLALEVGECAAFVGFEPCLMVDDGETVTFEPPECGCACPQR